jgi:glutamyl-tRNA reductase
VSLLVVGLSYRTAPVRLLEQATVGPEELPKVLHELLQGGHLSEALVLSTCNRVEIYAEVDRFHGGVHDVSSVLARRAGVDIPALGEHLYVHYEDAAVLHLFSVASGLDSMVVGESQILGQLRTAYQASVLEQTAGRSLHELCQQALRVGKRVHTETGIDGAGVSILTVGLGEAERVLGPLAGRRALIVGAGSMGALAAGTLRRAGVAEITVLNRTLARAERLAASLRPADGSAPVVRAGPMADLSDEIASADVVVACTGAVGQVISYDVVGAAVQNRAGRPLVLVDIALPRDIDAATSGLPGVRYVDLASLHAPAEELTPADDVARSQEIVSAEVASYLTAQRATAVAPTVAALRVRAAQVVESELIRLDGRVPGLAPRVRAEVAHTVHRVVQTLLHAPTVRVKELAGLPGGHAYAEVLRELFGLDPAATAVVSSVPLAPETVAPETVAPEMVALETDEDVR